MARDEEAGEEHQTALEVDMGPLGGDVGFQVHITRRAMWNALRTAGGKRKQRGSSGYISTLLLIGTNPGISPSQIASALFLDMPNVVQIVRMLDDAGLIERRRNPVDKRRLALSLTPEGQARFDHVVAYNRTQSWRVTNQLTEAEQRQLVELLGKVRLSIDTARQERPADAE